MKSFRVLQVAAASALALVPVLGTPAPASAATYCSTHQDKEFPTNGYNTDVTVKICIEQDVPTGAYRAIASVSWQEGAGNKFNNFDVHLRTEKYDVTFHGMVCDLTAQINRFEANHVDCKVAWDYRSPGGVTGDATVLYDIADDGEGELRWDLTGSPSM
ncbi:hypothetical protein ACF05T_09450 [Streptomyces lateritius]|uniref:Secreted protein n=1 Tax=Streptomyces lateritius TaxID=67313 RepID=A0ABW6Y9R2_9ACTN